LSPPPAPTDPTGRWATAGVTATPRQERLANRRSCTSAPPGERPELRPALPRSAPHRGAFKPPLGDQTYVRSTGPDEATTRPHRLTSVASSGERGVTPGCTRPGALSRAAGPGLTTSSVLSPQALRNLLVRAAGTRRSVDWWDLFADLDVSCTGFSSSLRVMVCESSRSSGRPGERICGASAGER
jgi:hypothetical protein